MLRARITHGGVEGDSWAHPRVHGGPAKAVLLITSEGIEELRAAGYAVYPGALGENLTTTGLDRKQIRIGSRFRVGNATIEITRMRVPCSTLDVLNEPGLPPIQSAIFDERVNAGDASSPRWGLGGFYARVIHEGEAGPGDAVALIEMVV